MGIIVAKDCCMLVGAPVGFVVGKTDKNATGNKVGGGVGVVLGDTVGIHEGCCGR